MIVQTDHQSTVFNYMANVAVATDRRILEVFLKDTRDRPVILFRS